MGAGIAGRMWIFTNDEAAVNALERADGRLEAVAWSDPMGFGRLPASADLDGYAAERAKVFAALRWEEEETAAADLRLRFAALESWTESGEEGCLLFGCSLRDQLQLAQICWWLAERGGAALRRARLMVVDGPLSIFDDGALLEVAKEGAALEAETLAAYRAAWLAVTSPEPLAAQALFEELRGRREELTLASALERWLQELPSWENGLSMTEGQILDAVGLGVATPGELFEAVQETEGAAFRTNWEFWQELDRLASGGDPLLEVPGGARFLCPPADLGWTAFAAQRLELTEAGRAVASGAVHAAELARPERWLGGTLLDGAARWYWNYGSQRIEGSPAAFSGS